MTKIVDVYSTILIDQISDQIMGVSKDTLAWYVLAGLMGLAIGGTAVIVVLSKYFMQ